MHYVHNVPRIYIYITRQHPLFLPGENTFCRSNSIEPKRIKRKKQGGWLLDAPDPITESENGFMEPTLRILGMSWGVKLPPVLRPFSGCHERRVWCFHRRGRWILRVNTCKYLALRFGDCTPLAHPLTFSD